MNKHINNKGFTLIELLVVISVIALLVSIIMPSLGSARQLAQRVSCGAALKGIGTSWAMYLDANNRNMPFKNEEGKIVEVFPYEKDSGQYNIMVALKDYVDENAGWKCPSNIGIENFELYGGSYEYALCYLGELMNDAGAEFFQKNAEQFPAEITVIYDAQSADTGESPHATLSKPDGQNHLFNDGHMEYASWDDISAKLDTIKNSLVPVTE